MMVPGAAVARGGRAFGAQRRKPGGGHRTHNGIDLFAPLGTPVRAPALAMVRIAERKYRRGFGGYGRVVVLAMPGGTELLIAHLDQVLVRVGQTVKPGTVIGTVGTTCFTKEDPSAHFRRSKPHVHVELLAGRYPTSSTTPRMDPTALAYGKKKVCPFCGGKTT